MSALAEKSFVPQADSGCAEVERRDSLTPEAFFAEYVGKRRPVLVSGALKGCPALSRWTTGHLRSVSGNTKVKLKEGLADTGVKAMKTVESSLSDYLDSLERYEALLRNNEACAKDRPAYLHDVPLLSILPGAASDLEGFPVGYFPEFYRRDWPKFAQFFLGPAHSLTPLHFDCLLTHNLFFQVAGRKRFILLPREQGRFCYRYQWRWFAVDAETPDYALHPQYMEARPMACVVEPGDMLYMPPGMLHHVRSLDMALSFNVDWHTLGSAIDGILALGQGMPAKNVYYNAVVALGMCAGLPARSILPWYGSYLNYVS